MFTVLLSGRGIVTVHQVHLTNVEQCQADVKSQTKPTDLGHDGPWVHLHAATIAIY